MTITADGPQAAARTAVKRTAKPAPPAAAPPAPRPRRIALTPMREQAAKSMSRLADQVQQAHPDMTVHAHVRDAARMLRSGNEEAAQRHLRAAAFALSPQSLMRNGVHTDDGHIAARQSMHGVHRHLLLVKDIQDAGERNRAAIARQAGEDDTSSPPVPAYGGDPGALAQKPVARQPGGDRALNAPARTNSGGSDPAVADPVGVQPKGSKQFARTWSELARVVELATVVELVGPHGYIHGWIFVGIPGIGAKVTMPSGRHATGKVEGSDKTHVHVRMDDGSLVHVQHSSRPGPGKLVPADQFKAPSDSITGKDGTLAAGDWQGGHQAIAQAPLSVLPADRSRYVDGKNVKGAWSDPWWTAKPGGGYAVSARWKSKEQKVFSSEPGSPFKMVTHPAMDERVMTPYGDIAAKQAKEREAQAQAASARQAAGDAARAEAAAAQKRQEAAAAAQQKRIEESNKAVAAQRARNEADRQRKADGAALAREKGIEPGAHVFIDAGPKKGGIGTVRSVGADGRATVEHMGSMLTLAPTDAHAHPLPGDETKRMAAVHASAESAKRDAEMRQREADAAQANSRGMDRMFARSAAQRVHWQESTGLTIPTATELGLGGGSSDYRRAENDLLAGNHAEGIANLGRALSYERAVRGKKTKAQEARLARLEKFRDQVAQATANPKPTLPALARLPGGGPKGMTALDHNGVEHKISLKDGTVTVSTDKGTRSGPALDDPTRTARMLAGSIAGTSPVVGTSRTGKPIRVGDTVSVRASQGPKWSDPFKAGGSGMVYSAPDGEHIQVVTGQKNGYISAKAGDIAHKQGAAAVEPARAAGKATPASPEHAAVSAAVGKARQAIAARVARNEALPAWEKDREVGNTADKAVAALGALEKESASGASVQEIGKRAADLDDSLKGNYGRGNLSHDQGVTDAMEGVKNAVIERQTGIAMRGVNPDAHHLEFDTGNGMKSYNYLADPESVRSYAQQGALRGLKMTEASGHPDLSGIPKSGQKLYQHAVANGWNASVYVDRDSDHNPIYKVVATNPETRQTSRQEFVRGKRSTYNAESVTRSMDRISQSPRPQYAAPEAATSKTVKTAYTWDDLAFVVELSAQTAALEVTPSPRGKPGGPGLYDIKNLSHMPYFQNVVRALITERGMPPGRAYAVAYGALRKWRRGGGHTHPEVRAAATGALAGEAAKGAMARAVHGHATTWDQLAAVIEAATVRGSDGTAIELISTQQNRAKAQAQPRVPAKQAGGGQFTTGSNAKPAAKGKTAPAKGKPAAKASTKQPPPKPKQTKQQAVQKEQLLAKASTARRQSAVDSVALAVYTSYLTSAQKGSTTSAQSGSTTSAQSGSTTAATAGSTSSSTTPTATQAAVTAATKAGVPSKAAAAAAAQAQTYAAKMNATQLQATVTMLTGKIKTLNSQAAQYTSQAAKL